MKQFITPKQLGELSKKGKEKLKNSWKPKYGDWVCFENKEYLLADCNSIKVDWNPKTAWDKEMSMFILDGMNDEYGEYKTIKEVNTILPLLSIGQMIEFLDKKGLKFSMTRLLNNYNQYKWNIEISVFIGEEGIDTIKPELCDALWEVVKEVLEK